AILFVVLSKLVPERHPPLPELLSALSVLGFVNIFYWWLGSRSEFPLRQFYFHWFVDLLLLSDILFLLGGVDVPYGLLAYLLIIVTSANFLSRGAAFRVATAASITTVLLGALRANGIIWSERVWAIEMNK